MYLLHSGGLFKQIWETQKKLLCPSFTKYKEFARPVGCPETPGQSKFLVCVYRRYGVYPLMKILPSVATTPFFTCSEILVDVIGMQVEELHSGVTWNSPALVFLTLLSLSLMCLSLYLLKLRSPLGNSLL